VNIKAGRWRARIVSLAQAEAALDLRARVFRSGACDADAYDAQARHLLIEDATGIAACARLTVQRGADVLTGYTAQHYDLSAFSAGFASALEVGRVCLAPECRDLDVPRLLLASLARIVGVEGAAVLYGCSSFPANGAGMARLADRQAPDAWAPRRKALLTQSLSRVPGPLPSLLRSYLSLGAAVSDHAVVDRDLGTLHVFTALPIEAIPPVRARLLTGMLDAV